MKKLCAFLLLCSMASADEPRRCNPDGAGKAKSKDPFDRACAHCQWKMRSGVGFAPNESFASCIDAQLKGKYRIDCSQEPNSILDERCVWYPSPSPSASPSRRSSPTAPPAR